MRIRMLVVLVALMGLLAVPAIAEAGCLAAGSGNPTYVDGSVRIFAGIQCTTNNGSHYQVRTYLQGDASGNFVNRSGPLTHDYFSPPNNYSNVLAYYFPCSALTPQDIHMRSAIVVENMVTHTTDVGHSGSVTRPANCQ